jgi:hypothetical protein
LAFSTSRAGLERLNYWERKLSFFFYVSLKNFAVSHLFYALHTRLTSEWARGFTYIAGSFGEAKPCDQRSALLPVSAEHFACPSALSTFCTETPPSNAYSTCSESSKSIDDPLARTLEE